MKKLLLLFAAMLVAVAATHAQTPTATLSHEGTVKCFYGKEALVNAVAEAENGDNITLSSGLFSGTTIDKAITLKGAGMSPDTINGITPTTINSDMTINTSDVTIEGTYIAANLTLNHFNNIKIIRTTITGVVDSQNLPNSEVRVNHYIINCNCVNITRIVNEANTDCYIENSYVNKLTNADYSTYAINQIVANNSIIGFVNNCYFYINNTGSTRNTVNSSFTNCFLYKAICNGNNHTHYDYIDGSNQAFYCVGLGNEIFCQVIGGTAGNTNATIENFSDFFKTFDGNYNDNETFELTAAAQTTYLGDDGTQVGIYGGSMPFNPKPNNPYITKLTVAEKSTPQGTLSVDIQVQPAQ